MQNAKCTMQNARCRQPNARAICAVLAIGPLALCSTVAGAEIIDRVLAIVGGGVITQSDVTAAFELQLVTIEKTDDPIAAVLSQLIDQSLILIEVDRYAPPEPTTEAIDRAAEQVRMPFATLRPMTPRWRDRASIRRGCARPCETGCASAPISISASQCRHRPTMSWRGTTAIISETSRAAGRSCPSAARVPRSSPP
jgi:hypothetical protein